jgi:hypothetical protein
MKKRFNSVLSFVRKQSKHTKFIALGVFVALLVGGAVGTKHASVVQSRRQAEIQEHELQLAKQEQAALEQAQAEKKQQQDQPSENTAAAAQPQAENKKEIKKYSTSSDPRSTAYSTTPPAPHPNSFTIKITHSGQLAYGDVMFYNATKPEKGYYGGDLVLSPASVTISRTGSKIAPITVSSSNGTTLSMPSMPWDDQNPHFFIAFPGYSAPPAAASYNMIVDTYNMPAVGTYTLHIFSGCSGFGNDACESHGFITVNVVN